ncbi:hypothetical protein K0M31_006156 [Melipona bicolor]|uniref:Uncharacterized protein n=1 Tax=Melipona bicolor TaxID=60889 RepID=A0AA40KLM6_9HYME|nr:hypothetical protein K0M31_006156 [Melipona bicolor]
MACTFLLNTLHLTKQVLQGGKGNDYQRLPSEMADKDKHFGNAVANSVCAGDLRAQRVTAMVPFPPERLTWVS